MQRQPACAERPRLAASASVLTFQSATPPRRGRPARARDRTNAVAPLLDKLHALGIDPETCAMDVGYDNGLMGDACTGRGIVPIIPLRETPAVKRGEHKPPRCEHGEWRFAGADYSRKATKWRCPTGECKPASILIKADRLHPLIPRETLRWRGLYRGRGSVEREVGRLKNERALTPLRVRGIERVRLHADLTILAKLSCALARARAVPLAGVGGSRLLCEPSGRIRLAWQPVS